MLSFGIQFGEGFDRSTILKIMQAAPVPYQYDFLVIGSHPGGIACAREASMAGRKTAIVTSKKYTPAESEGFDENLEELAEILEGKRVSHVQSMKRMSSTKSVRSIAESVKGLMKETNDPSPDYVNKVAGILASEKEPKGNIRKVRLSRLDLSNELFKRGKECRKLMRSASTYGQLIEDGKKNGWRVFYTTPTLSLNWQKMSEEVMDYVMKENWKLAMALKEENIEVIEANVKFVNKHTVKIWLQDNTESEITAENICLALSAEYIFPDDVKGALEFGINCDDFYRMDAPPGKTLIVGGSLSESFECAGILANCRFPVTILLQAPLLQGCDPEITSMIVTNLQEKGVLFVEDLDLKAIEKAENKKLLVTFTLKPSNTSAKPKEVQETFDTVLFAIGKKVPLDHLNIQEIGVTCDEKTQKILTDGNDATTVSNIFALGDAVWNNPEGYDVAELAGRLLGKRLFRNEQETMDYSMIPSLLLTPTEYGCVGMTESSALRRLGKECVGIYYGYFTPLEYIICQKADQCFAKIIVYKGQNKVVGLHVYGPEAGEIIQGFAAAIKVGMTLSQFKKITGVPTTKAQEVLKLKTPKILIPGEEVSLL